MLAASVGSVCVDVSAGLGRLDWVIAKLHEDSSGKLKVPIFDSLFTPDLAYPAHV